MNKNILEKELDLFFDWTWEKLMQDERSASIHAIDFLSDEFVEEYMEQRAEFVRKQKEKWKYLYEDIII